MKKKLTNNLSLKIFSVVIAVIIWFFAYSVSDPVTTKEYPVKVTVTNDSYILDSGKTYQIADQDRTVMVYITGKTSVVQNRSDIIVEADMTQIVEMKKDARQVYVPVQFKPVPGISMKDVDVYPKTIPVSIEDVETKDFMITVNTKGIPGSGYEIGETTVSPEKISIQGPKSTVEKIKSVVATVNVSGMTLDTSKDADITILDQAGNPLTEDAMEYLKVYNVGEDRTVEVSVKLWRIVDGIKVKANYTGVPAKGYQVAKIVTIPETISVAGSEEALARLQENGNEIEIPANLIKVDGIDQDLEANIKLSSLLGENTELKVPTDMAQSIMVKVSILPYGSKEFEIPTGNIQVEGMNNKLRASFNQNTVTVRVKGSYASLQELSVQDIQVSIDLTDKLAGEYNLPLTVHLPDGYEQVDNTLTTVLLTQVDN